MFAGRKRRKSAQKSVKQNPAEGAKSNPSKRHRDRLNSELDRLASLLPFPEDITTSLDKLSILRLSVSYLRTKSFFSVTLKKSGDQKDGSGTTGSVDGCIPEGELLLQTNSSSSVRCGQMLAGRHCDSVRTRCHHLHSEPSRPEEDGDGGALNGFVLVVTAEGIIFFCSHTIQDYLGFHQTDVMHQSVFELIHTEDHQEFRRNLHWALNPPASLGPPTDPSPDGECASTSSCPVSYSPDQLPPENSSFLERSFVCRFRCLLDNSSGFLALNIQGRLKFLHGQSRQPCDGETSTPPQLALFAIATPLQPPAILEIRTRNMIFRTKHKLDFTPMACDAKGKIVLGYTEAELRVRGTGYQFIHAADMLYCAENHIRMIKTGESGLTVFRLLTKDNRWKWVQANARLVYKNGKPDYIIATQRPLVDEEGGEHLRKRSMHLPFTFATGEALLYQTSYPLHGFPDSFQGKAKGSKSRKGKVDRNSSDDLDPKSLLGALMSQDESVYVCQPDTEPKLSYRSSLFIEQHSETDGFGGLLSGDSWHIVSNVETGMCNSEMTNYDPLLATLDLLSLDGDETCSNSELFNALENLGLNAEDLELLLLDKRMIQVELDPNHIPTLSDLLTNNEILSYIHDSLESVTDTEEQGPRGGFGPSAHPPVPESVQSVSQQECFTAAIPAALPSSRQPIVHLSQQMQQHISAGELVKTHIQSETADTNILPGIPNSQWVATTENHHHSDNHTHDNPHTVLKASQLNGDHNHLNTLRESSEQWQVQQDQPSVHLQSPQPISSQSTLLPGFQNPLGLTTNGSYIPNGHTTFLPNVGVVHSDYIHAGDAVQNGVTTPDGCHYQTLVAFSRPHQVQKHQQQQMLQQTHVPPSCLPQRPTQSSALDLEQFLGLSQPQQSLSSLEAYGEFNTNMEDTTHSKLESSYLLSATNAAFVRTCLMPSGNAVATGEVPVSCPSGLATLQDPQKSGFFL